MKKDREDGPVRNRSVNGFTRKVKWWRDELEALRTIVLGTSLKEEIKWRQPCYTYEGKNVVILGEFREYASLSFFKGSLLNDPDGILEAPGENARAARLFRFTSVTQIEEMETVIKAYITEAIEVEKAGLKVDFEKDRDLPLPEELQTKLDEDLALKSAWDALTPGRRRSWLLHFSSAKQSKTRVARIERATPKILAGKGQLDR